MTSDTARPRRFRRGWYRLLTFLVSLLSVALLLVWIPIAEVWSALLTVDWRWLLLASAFTFLNLLLRGLRWAEILGRRSGRDVKIATYLCALAVGFNALFPGKVGELARIALAARHLRLRVGRIVAAALAERLIDLLVLLALVALPLSYVQAPAGESDSVFIAGLYRLARNLGWAGLLGVAGLMLLGHGGLNRRLRGAVFGLLRRRYPRIARGLHRALFELRRALVYLASPLRLVRVLGLTFVMWLALGCGVFVAAWGSAQVALSLPLALAFAALTVLAAALPSAPGAWGVFEAAGVVFLVGLTGDADRASVLAFVVAVHLIQYLPVVLAGWASWLLIGREPAVHVGRG